MPPLCASIGLYLPSQKQTSIPVCELLTFVLVSQPTFEQQAKFLDAQDDHLETLSTSTCCSLHYFQSCKEFIDAARAYVGESCSMPSSAVGSVGNDKGAVYCFLFIPPSVAWAAGLSRWGCSPLNPGRPLREQERASEYHL